MKGNISALENRLNTWDNRIYNVEEDMGNLTNNTNLKFNETDERLDNMWASLSADVVSEVDFKGDVLEDQWDEKISDFRKMFVQTPDFNDTINDLRVDLYRLENSDPYMMYAFYLAIAFLGAFVLKDEIKRFIKRGPKIIQNRRKIMSTERKTSDQIALDVKKIRKLKLEASKSNLDKIQKDMLIKKIDDSDIRDDVDLKEEIEILENLNKEKGKRRAKRRRKD